MLAAALVVVLVLALIIFLRYYVDWLWFGEVSLRTVFWKRITLSVILGPVFGVVFFAIIYGNIEIARRLAPKYRPVEGIDVLEPIRETAVKRVRLVGLVLSLLLAIVVAFVTAGSWLTFAKALDGVSFGTKDAIFHHDLSFYVFALPAWQYIYSFVLVVLIVAVVVSIAIWFLLGGIQVQGNRPPSPEGPLANLKGEASEGMC